MENGQKQQTVEDVRNGGKKRPFCQSKGKKTNNHKQEVSHMKRSPSSLKIYRVPSPSEIRYGTDSRFE